MLRDWWEKLKRILTAGIGVKLCLIMGGVVLVSFLHGLVWDFIAPAIDTILYIISHISQIAHK